MITSELIEYIKLQISKNISKDLIISRLADAGWRMEDIEEGLSTIESSVVTPIEEFSSIPEKKEDEFLVVENEKIEEIQKIQEQVNPVEIQEIEKTIDPYRELPEGVEIEKASTYNTPTIEKPVLSSVPYRTPVIEKPIENNIYIAPVVEKTIESNVEVSPTIVEKPAESSVESIATFFDKTAEVKPEPAKIWVPTSIKSISEEITPTEDFKKPVGVKEEEIVFSRGMDMEPYRTEIGEEKIISPVFTPTTISPILPKVEKPILEVNINTAVSSGPELIPTINKTPFTVPEQQTVVVSPRIIPVKPTQPVVSMTDMSPKSAMIASYTQDILAAKKEPEQSPFKKPSMLKIGIIIFIISIIGGMIFAFIEGYIKVPWSNLIFSVVKKDPKTIILNYPAAVAGLNSYKVDTDINIISPSLSSITTGLSSGEAVNTKDSDSISFSTKGVANHIDGKLFFDYLIDLKSSLFKKDIKSNIKYNGSELYIAVPELNQILEKDAPEPVNLSVLPNDIGLIIPEFSKSTQEMIKKFDMYNIASGDVPVYTKNETISIFKNFINSLEYTEKGKDTIHGVSTYHYEMIADRISTKKLLISFADLYMANLPDDQKKQLDEALGASTISAFDVWVGENDDNLYQIEFTLNMPLSRVFGLNDSGIAGNEVKLSWKTTYYDLNVDNNIVIPKAEVDINGFIKKIKDLKIRNLILSFNQQAVSFRNATGSYGKKLNPTGSCINPNPGSLFSPQGHVKGADTSVGGISSLMNSMLEITNGNGLCYSTPQAWALSAPLNFVKNSDESDSYYCTDSVGNIVTLPYQIKGAVCK